MRILGLSCFYHDAAACLVEDGIIIAAAEEERFTRKKHDAAFPRNAVRYCLAEAGVEPGGRIDAVAFYDKPLLKFQRIVETYFAIAPRGLRSFLHSLPVWTKEKLWTEPAITDALAELRVEVTEPLRFLEHHESHAASAFYPSPFQDAAVVTLDGVGEWATATIGVGEGDKLELVEELDFPHSLGLLYSAFTYFTGFRVNSGEYKLMGLAPYGTGRYTKTILDHLLDLKDDGSFRLNLPYFGYLDGLTMTNARFADLFGGPPRAAESPVTRREQDLARSIQEVTEEIVLRIARHARKLTGKPRVCMAGGVALNCVANGRLLREGLFDDIWVQPAAGDSGGALGAALRVWHGVKRQPRKVDGRHDAMQGALLGPEFDDSDIREYLTTRGYPFEELSPEIAPDRIAGLIENEKVIGLCQGRMEFGPRALGNRSIIADARSPRMQSVVNLKVKFRESFRPFAPAVLEERVSDYFELDRPSPYMLLVAPVKTDRRLPPGEHDADLPVMEWVNKPRSDVPAITHVDYSARVQTVSKDVNPRFYALLKAFERRTGCGLVINTSFNVRGEPIVCTPEDAYRCFMTSAIDYLVLGSFLLDRQNQPVWHDMGPKKPMILD
jgi:carbamoyltransferase